MPANRNAFFDLTTAENVEHAIQLTDQFPDGGLFDVFIISYLNVTFYFCSDIGVIRFCHMSYAHFFYKPFYIVNLTRLVSGHSGKNRINGYLIYFIHTSAYINHTCTLVKLIHPHPPCS